MVKNKKKISVIVNDNLFMIISCLIFITIIILFVNYFNNRSNIDPNSDLINELHNYFKTDEIDSCNGFLNYSTEEVNNENISVKNKLCLAYQKADYREYESEKIKKIAKAEICKKDNMIFRITEDTEECVINKIPKEIIDNSYKKLFGQEISDNSEFYIDNLNICYLKDDYYYCGLAETYTYILESPSEIYRNIRKVISKEKSSEIQIYDYFLKTTDSKCYLNYTTLNTNENCNKIVAKNKEKELNYGFVKKYGTEYIHTYKKANDGTYYWVSSKPVK